MTSLPVVVSDYSGHSYNASNDPSCAKKNIPAEDFHMNTFEYGLTFM